MSEFNEVKPLKCRTGVEAHIECAVVHRLHGKQYVVCQAPIFDYEQAVQLRDWLNAALREGVPRLREYVRHKSDCDHDSLNEVPCTCGLDAALAQEGTPRG
jgi:hypothetical protein